MQAEKTAVILQSNYIPWKGYFDLVNAADVFILFDEVQFTRRDWRNRNRIIVGGEPRWLTIPVQTKGKYNVAIRDIEVVGANWAIKHWSTVRSAYAKAPFFARYAPGLEDAYDRAASETNLSPINRVFLAYLAACLDINTRFADCAEVPRTSADPTTRLIELCQHFGATRYLSGPAAKNYIDPEAFCGADIELRYADYTGYPEYNQNTQCFEHGVSIIDVLMQVGPDARTHLKSMQRDGLLEYHGQT